MSKKCCTFAPAKVCACTKSSLLRTEDRATSIYALVQWTKKEEDIKILWKKFLITFFPCVPPRTVKPAKDL